MINLSLLALIFVPVLAAALSWKSDTGPDVLSDQIIPRDVDVRPWAAHWGIPAGVTHVNHALLTEIKCHPDFIERDIPDLWYKWTPADARRRARQRGTHDERAGVLSIRKHA